MFTFAIEPWPQTSAVNCPLATAATHHLHLAKWPGNPDFQKYLIDIADGPIPHEEIE